MDLGPRIAQLRKRAGLNQSELARALQVTPQTVQAWEKGGGIRPAKFEALAQALGISLGTLLLGDGYADPSRPVRPNPTMVTRAAEALLVFLRRRDPGATLDLTKPQDAELFAAAYAEAIAAPATESGSLALGAVVADLVEASKQGEVDGQRDEQAGGPTREKARKARAGA